MKEKMLELAKTAYLYGFPMVFDLEQVLRFTTTGIGANAAAPFNQFSHSQTLATDKDTFVSINNDTVYSMAQIDLSVGPIVFHVPDVGERYYVMQFVDAWTNNFAYVGTRGTGTKAADFYITPADFTGEVPSGMIQIKAPTRVISIVGRWACNGEADLPNIITLQEQTSLKQVILDAQPIGLPKYDETVPKSLLFFEKMRVYMAAFPPAAHFVEFQQTFKALGLLDSNEVSPLPNLDTDIKAVLEDTAAMGDDLLKTLIKNSTTKTENGWQLAYHAFDYNSDFFEVGTIKSPDWIINDTMAAINERAVSAFAGLWGNHGYEAAYIMTWTDEQGNTLNGSNTYQLKLETMPPVNAFWSLTMYSLPHYYLVANPIQRYSIGDRTPGLHYNADGSLTITISKEVPKDENANWLPAPEGDFRPILRMYSPDESILDYRYHFPAIEKL